MNTIDAIQLRIEELTQKRELNKEKMQPMFKENSELTDEIQELEAQVIKLRSESISTEEDMIKFYLEDDGKSRGMDHYYARKSFFESIGLGVFGRNSITEQSSIQISLEKDGSNLNLVQESILKLLPHLIPFDGSSYERSKVVLFQISEHTLSEYGCYTLVYDFYEDVWAISKIAWHRRSEVQQFDFLTDALEYICTNHYAYNYDDDDDDEEEEE